MHIKNILSNTLQLDMNLPFRYQFSLAPLVIVVLLACLVVYTLFELSNIHRENQLTVKWELLTDRIQVARANITLTDRLVTDLIESPLSSDDDRLFTYIEQTRILADALIDPVLIPEIPSSLRVKMQTAEALLEEPELSDPKRIHDALLVLEPALSYQYKLFLAQRRTAFIEYHHNLAVILPRLSGALLTVLIVCIVLAIGLSVWGLTQLRRRLRALSQSAHAISCGETPTLVEPETIRDELDNLEVSLARAAKRLINVYAVEKVIQGTELERRRIAMDMHDGVLAELTAITRKIDALSGLSKSEQNELQVATQEITQSIRNTIDDLHPQTLDILGLEAALRSFLDRQLCLPDSPSEHFDFDIKLEDRLQALQKINLFRVITEVIHNALRHAQCKNIEISLRIVSNQLILSIEDDGVGMTQVPDQLGHGCANIVERARILNAGVQWKHSRFSSGTYFEFTMSLT